MPTYFQRPENALKRANELLHVGKKQRALDALYDVIKSKKHKTWQKIHEPIMKLYLELCVDLKKSHIAKEGLFQYRNICQQVNIKSLEDVVRGYLKLAEDKTEEARQTSQQAVVDIDDLDQVTTPEGLLLSAVSGEDSQDRTDRVVLIPWVKFLWESYRQCLELLRNNSRVERLYHDIAQQAFKFCLNYTRKTEFRKLCDNLRTHLGQIHRHQHQQTAINLGNPESQAMHLETRLFQLDSAITMELWQEAYKAIEDVHGLMALSKKSPKPQLMANYYQKLALVFWKAGNYLFHAAALFRLFHLSRDMKKNLTQEDLQKMASRVAMATLAIPLPPARSEVDRFLETDESVVEKNRKLANLLGLTNPPTRISLCKDLVRHSVLPYVMPEIQDLHRWLEVEFHPLELCTRVQNSLQCLEPNNEPGDLSQYVPAIQNISIMRLLFQVSQIYETIEFSRLLTLAPFVGQFQLESLIVDAARRNDLQVVIDHKNSCLHFGTNLGMSETDQGGSRVQSMPGEQIRNQLVQMCDALLSAVFTIQPGRKQMKNDEVRQRVVAAYKNTADKDHRNILLRRQIIEKRKEDLENQSIQREEEERHQQEVTRRNQQKAEAERLKREAEERDRQRKLMELREVQKKQVKDKIEQLKKSDLGARIFQDIDEEELENLDTDMIMAKQVEQLDKERKELQSRLKSQEKKIDYMERAKRLEEIPLLQKAHEEFLIKDKEFWELQEADRIKEAIADRELALQTSERLQRIRKDKDEFFNKLKSDRGADFKTKLEDFKVRLEAEKITRLLERKTRRKEERKNKARKEREEEEQRRHDEQIKNELEEKERVAAANKAKVDEEHRLHMEKLNQIEAKKRERELEIEMKLKENDEEKHRTAPYRPSAMARDFRRDINADESDGMRRRQDDQGRGPANEDMGWRRGGRSDDRGGFGREDDGAKDEGSWRKSGPEERSNEDAWRKRDGGGRDGDRWRNFDDKPRDDKWSRDNRGSRDDRGHRDDRYDDRGPRDDRFRDDRGGSKEDRFRDDRGGPREDRFRDDRGGPRDDRFRDDRGPRDDRWGRGGEDRGSRDDRWGRGGEDRGPRDDKWNARERWGRNDDRDREDSWRSKGNDDRRKDDRWGRDDRRPRDGGDSWRRGGDDRSFGSDREWRRDKPEDDSFNRRRVPVDKDGFPADRVPIGGRRAPPPRGRDYDRNTDDAWRQPR